MEHQRQKELEERTKLYQILLEPSIQYGSMHNLETTAIPNLCSKLSYECIQILLYNPNIAFQLAERFRSNPKEVIDEIKQLKFQI